MLKNKRVLFFLLALMVFLFDQSTKVLIAAQMRPGKSIEIIDHFFNITYVQNTGAAFGILKNANLFLLAIGVVVLGVVVYFHFHLSLQRKFEHLALALVLGGSLGNLSDRLFRGYVVDFIDFRVWPVFNFADTFINVGIFVLIVSLLFIREKKDVPGPA